MRQEDEAGGPQDTGKAQEPEGSAEKAGSKKDKYQKAQAKAEHAGEKLGKAREKLDKTEAKRAAKKPPGLAKKAVRGARTEAWFYVHNKIHEVEHENVGVEGAHKSELAAEAGTRKLTRYAKRRWREHPARKVAKWERKDIKARANVDFQKMASEHPELASNPLSRVQQKWKLKRRYSKEAKAAAKQGAKAAKKTAAASGTATRRAAQFVTRHPVAVLVLLLLLLLCFLVSAVSSIFPTLGSGLANALSGTSYASEDTDLLGVDEDYTALENELAQTTMFKILMGELEPDEGSVKWGQTVTTSYLPKDNSAYFDGQSESLVDWIRQFSAKKDDVYLRGFLGRMLFSGEEVFKPVNVLSGGEKVRCMLSRMMLSGANVILLDQPTNHLDLESIAALNNGMAAFPYNIIFTSHDHQLTQTVANRIIEITPDGIIDRRCTYDEYMHITGQETE